MAKGVKYSILRFDFRVRMKNITVRAKSVRDFRSLFWKRCQKNCQTSDENYKNKIKSADQIKNLVRIPFAAHADYTLVIYQTDLHRLLPGESDVVGEVRIDDEAGQ